MNEWVVGLILLASFITGWVMRGCARRKRLEAERERAEFDNQRAEVQSRIARVCRRTDGKIV